MVPNETNLVWEVVTAFFRSKKSFNEQREKYERMVTNYARKKSVDRRELHLGTREVAGLLDFEPIEQLRNHYMRNLKDLSHRMFRTEGTIDSFDKYVSDIYHEVSILKEELYTVLTYAPAYEEGSQPDLTERDKILDEVHEFFPRKIEQIRNLFEKAQARLEEILPQFGENRIFVRSVYLFGGEILKKYSKNGLDGFYSRIYPSGGAVQGYLTVARSFYEAGFHQEADKALRKARAALKRSSFTEEEKKKKREEIKQLAKLAASALAD
jgi:hypothetical protein